jgi:FkbM family methyltransferase
MDIWVIKETLFDRFYDRCGMQVRKDWNILDIGGGLGDYTVYAARQASSGTVYAFEPLPESFSLMEQNCRENGVKNVALFAEAIWSKDSEVALDTDTGPQVTFMSHQATEHSTSKIRARSVTLETALRSLNLNRCDLLKMDCEGAEYDILLNTSADTLKKIDRITMEYHDNLTPHSHVELISFLINQGYHVETRRCFVHDDRGYLYARRAELNDYLPA